jgi:hypothetical protein
VCVSVIIWHLEGSDRSDERGNGEELHFGVLQGNVIPSFVMVMNNIVIH